MGAALIMYVLVSAWRRLPDPGTTVKGVGAAVFWALLGALLLTGFSAALFPLSFIPFGMAFFARRVEPRTAWLSLAAPAAVAGCWVATVNERARNAGHGNEFGSKWLVGFGSLFAFALILALLFEHRARAAQARQYTAATKAWHH